MTHLAIRSPALRSTFGETELTLLKTILVIVSPKFWSLTICECSSIPLKENAGYRLIRRGSRSVRYTTEVVVSSNFISRCRTLLLATERQSVCSRTRLREERVQRPVHANSYLAVGGATSPARGQSATLWPTGSRKFQFCPISDHRIEFGHLFSAHHRLWWAQTEIFYNQIS